MTFLERTERALCWGLGRLREYLATWRQVRPQFRLRAFRGYDIYDWSSWVARSQAAHRQHWVDSDYVFIRVLSWKLIYFYAYISMSGGDGVLFRQPWVQEQIVFESMTLAARIMGGTLNVPAQ